jgi:hypothetical protein
MSGTAKTNTSTNKVKITSPTLSILARHLMRSRPELNAPFCCRATTSSRGKTVPSYG